MLDLALIKAFMYVLGLSIIILSPFSLLIATLLLSLGQYLLSYFLVLGCIVEQVFLRLPGVACVIVILLALFLFYLALLIDFCLERDWNALSEVKFQDLLTRGCQNTRMGGGVGGKTVKTSLDTFIHKLDNCQFTVGLVVWLRILALRASLIMDVKLCKLLKLCHVFNVGRLAYLCLSHHDPFLTDLSNDNALPADVSQLQYIAVDNPVCDLQLLHPILLEYGNTP
jgi:hypothetical protein